MNIGDKNQELLAKECQDLRNINRELLDAAAFAIKQLKFIRNEDNYLNPWFAPEEYANKAFNSLNEAIAKAKGAEATKTPNFEEKTKEVLRLVDEASKDIDEYLEMDIPSEYARGDIGRKLSALRGEVQSALQE